MDSVGMEVFIEYQFGWDTRDTFFVPKVKSKEERAVNDLTHFEKTRFFCRKLQRCLR